MEREAREEARELEKQLIESRQQYKQEFHRSFIHSEMNISYQPGVWRMMFLVNKQRSMYSDGTEQQREAVDFYKEKIYVQKISSAIILQKLKKQQRKRCR